VPLGGRFVTHFWRLLDGLHIPYATLLDLDLGRTHGGAKAIRYVVAELAASGNDLSENRSVKADLVDPSLVDQIDEAELLAEDQRHPWLEALRQEGVYFSSPIDIDFAMAVCFPNAYHHPRDGGRGPRSDPTSIQQKKATSLKTGGKPNLYPSDWDEDFKWYPYLFLTDSKPEAHLRALSRLTAEELANNAPDELVRLIKHVKRELQI